MSIQCDTDSSFITGIGKINNKATMYDFFELYELEISSPSPIEGLTILYNVSASSLAQLFSKVLDDQKVIVGLVGYDLYRSTLREISSQTGAEPDFLLNPVDIRWDFQ